jgi:hypothetical protein
LLTYIEERPGKVVQVLIDDVWCDGTLEAWRRTDGRWRGYVRWTVRVGMRHLGWGRPGPAAAGLASKPYECCKCQTPCTTPADPAGLKDRETGTSM